MRRRQNTIDKGVQKAPSDDSVATAVRNDSFHNDEHDKHFDEELIRRRSSGRRRSLDPSIRDSYGRARSQPPKRPSTISNSSGPRKSYPLYVPPVQESRHHGDGSVLRNSQSKRPSLAEKIEIESESGTKVEVTVPISHEVRRRSVDDNEFEFQRRRRLSRRKSDSLEEVEVTRHMLFKEALYTAIHMLGRPTKRFPSTKEELSLYVVQTFCDSEQEEHAVIEHIKNDAFPVTIVNTKIIRAEGLQALEMTRIPNPYCVITIQEDESSVVFQMGKKEWPNYVSPNALQKIKNMIAPPSGNKKMNSHPLPERRSQVYHKVMTYKTTLLRRTNSPVWDQKFQVLVSKPSTDTLTVEAWDHPMDEHLIESIQVYRELESSDKRQSVVDRKGEGKKMSLRKRWSSPASGDQAGRLSAVALAGIEAEDGFLGKVSMKVAEFGCEGVEGWYHLGGKTKGDKPAHGKLRIAFWLVYAFRHGRHYVELVEPKIMLESLWDWILGVEKVKNGPDWDGSLCQPATVLLFQYALQNGISEDTHAVIRWNAYAKHKLTLHEIGTALNDLDGALDRKASVEHPLRRDDSQEEIEDSFMNIMKTQILPIIRNHLNEHEDTVTGACKSFKKLKQVLSKFDFSPVLFRIIWLFENAIRLCILEWYQAMFNETVHHVPGMKRSEYVSLYVEVVNQVIVLIKLGFSKWGKVFYLNSDTEYMTVIYDELQKMINHDIEPLCWSILEFYHDNLFLREILLQENKDEELLCKALSSLYFVTQIFAEMKEEIFISISDAPAYTNLVEYHRWFRPVLVLWLGFAVTRGSEMVTKCINIDNASLDNMHSKTSSSALDTANVFHQLVDFWKRMRWPDIGENYVIIHFLIEVMCYYTVLYAKRKHEKLELEGYFDSVDRFDISDRLCTALNNIEYVKEYVEKIPVEISQEKLLGALEQECGVTKETQAYRSRLEFILTLTFANVEAIFKTILNGLGNRIRPEITIFVQESLHIVRNSSEKDVIAILNEAREPLLNYLETNIVTLQDSLLELNFARLLQLFWNVFNQEIRRHTVLFLLGDTREQEVFYNRVLQLIGIIEEYFRGGDAGLTAEELNTFDYRETQTLITYYTIETSYLIGVYYTSRAEEQIQTGLMTIKNKDKPKLGHISVRVNYWDKRLNVEIISASDLTLSDNSFHILDICKKRTPTNDPFVEVELRPSNNFSDARKSLTETRWKTVDPIFNETFQWDVTLSECLKDSSVVIFTVKDYDYLSRNDFLGEAIVPLSMIPGVSTKPLAQPMLLHLREVEPSPVLQVLQSRTWDKEATRFTTEQFQRQVQVP